MRGTGAIQVAVANQRPVGVALCDAVGIDPNDTRFVTNGERVAHRDELINPTSEEHLARRSARDWLEPLDP